jgi:hypothetical protein
MTMTDDYIFCPRAQSSMTPCIARDGRLALADSNVCVGCAEKPSELISDLAERYEPARVRGSNQPKAAADRFRDLVANYVNMQ